MRHLLVGLVLLGLSAAAPAQGLPPDLNLVPKNAVGFLHLRVKDYWNSPMLKLHRQVLQNAGPDAIKMLEERIVPPLSTLDRVTVFAMPGGNDIDVAAIIRVNKPFDDKKLTAGLDAVREDGMNLYVMGNGKFTLEIIDKQTFVVGSRGAPAARRKGGLVGFPDAVALAVSGTQSIVMAADLSKLPPQALANLRKDVPPPLAPLLQADYAQVTLNLVKGFSVEARLRFPNKAGADDAERSLDQLRQLATMFLAKFRKEAENKLPANDDPVAIFDIDKVGALIGPVAMLGAAKTGEELLKALPITRKENTLALRVTAPEEFQTMALATPVLVALLLPAVQKVREAAARTQDQNQMKQIGLAMHIYHDIHKKFPSPAICDKAGKPLLSWRVAILPYIEEDNLYKQFRLDEPWDSDHNKKLIPRMPAIFTIPDAPAAPGETHYRVVVSKPGDGTRALFQSYNDAVRFAQIVDGTSNTLMVVQGEKAGPWTKPDELVYDPKGPLPKLLRRPRGYHVGMCDGSIRVLPFTTPEATLRGLITRDGGEAFQLDGD